MPICSGHWPARRHTSRLKWATYVMRCSVIQRLVLKLQEYRRQTLDQKNHSAFRNPILPNVEMRRVHAPFNRKDPRTSETILSGPSASSLSQPFPATANPRGAPAVEARPFPHSSNFYYSSTSPAPERQLIM